MVLDISIMELRKIVMECRKSGISEEDILKKLKAEKSATFSEEEIERSIVATPTVSSLKKAGIYDLFIYLICIGMIAYMLLNPYENKFIDYLIFGSEIFFSWMKPWGSLRMTVFIFAIVILSTSWSNALAMILLLILIIIRKKILYPKLKVLSGKPITV